jgi:hypothetical protein
VKLLNLFGLELAIFHFSKVISRFSRKSELYLYTTSICVWLLRMYLSHAQISLDLHQNLLVKEHIGSHPTRLHSAKAQTNRAATATKSAFGKRGCVVSAAHLEARSYDRVGRVPDFDHLRSIRSFFTSIFRARKTTAMANSRSMRGLAT